MGIRRGYRPGEWAEEVTWVEDIELRPRTILSARERASKTLGAVFEVRFDSSLEVDVAERSTSPFVASLLARSLSGEVLPNHSEPGPNGGYFAYFSGVPGGDLRLHRLSTHARVALVHDLALAFDDIHANCRDLGRDGLQYTSMFRVGFRGGVWVLPLIVRPSPLSQYPPPGLEMYLDLKSIREDEAREALAAIVRASGLPAAEVYREECWRVLAPGVLAGFAGRLSAAFDLPDARIALAAEVREGFTTLREAQARFMADAEANRVTQPALRVGVERIRLASGALLDAQPVTRAQFDAFLEGTGRPRPVGYPVAPGLGSRAATWVGFEDAHAYCLWMGARLPTSAEWDDWVRTCKPSSRGLWEWTSDVVRGSRRGWVVRGGRWRNADLAPSPTNSSYESEPAHDVGFRCAWDHQPEAG